MPKLDLTRIALRLGSDYPPPNDGPVAGRTVRFLSEAAGLNDFVVAHAIVPPGGWSSQRHWHVSEDELVIVVAGEGTLVEEHARTLLRRGDIAAFPKGRPDGHHIVNDGDEPLVMVALSLPERSPCHYPDLRLVWTPDGGYRPDQAG